jgi:hypothetical protein
MSKEPFVTVIRAMYGYKAALFVWSEEEGGGFWEPWNTTNFHHATIDEAEAIAKDWARVEEVKFVPYEGGRIA